MRVVALGGGDLLPAQRLEPEQEVGDLALLGGAARRLHHLPVRVALALHGERLARRHQPGALDVAHVESGHQALVAKIIRPATDLGERLGLDEHHRAAPRDRRHRRGLPAADLPGRREEKDLGLLRTFLPDLDGQRGLGEIARNRGGVLVEEPGGTEVTDLPEHVVDGAGIGLEGLRRGELPADAVLLDDDGAPRAVQLDTADLVILVGEHDLVPEHAYRLGDGDPDLLGHQHHARLPRPHHVHPLLVLVLAPEEEACGRRVPCPCPPRG